MRKYNLSPTNISSINSFKKNKLPIAIRLVRFFIPFIEKISPALSGKIIFNAFFTPVRFAIPEKESRFARLANPETIAVNNMNVRSYCWGSGPETLIFMHGWSSRATHFHVMIRELTAAGYRCIAFDAPAHGASEGKTADLFSFGNTLLELGKKYGPVHAIISHSLGGAAAIYAISKGLSVRKLVIMNTPTVASEIIHSSCRNLNAGVKSEYHLAALIRKKYGEDLGKFTAETLAGHTSLPSTLLVYDDNDPDAALINGSIMHKAIINSGLFITNNLGHHRSLKDELTINTIKTFLQL